MKYLTQILLLEYFSDKFFRTVIKKKIMSIQMC